MEITKDNYRKLNNLYEFLVYSRTCITEDVKGLKKQDYIDPKILDDKIEKLKKDLEAYSKNLRDKTPYIFKGNILRIDVTDAISYVSYKYYEILDLKDYDLIICNILEVTSGDYEKSISYKTDEKINSYELVSEYHTYYHQEGEDVKNQYENYKKFLDNLQPPK